MTGLLTIVGLGPGAEDLLTPRARAALKAAEVVVGYGLYLDMVRAWLPGLRCIDSPIGEEEARARLSLDLARGGQRVALVSSGDAGVYGMAGLALELASAPPTDAGDEPLRIVVVPGVTAAQAAASIVGAPLMADYATISLSDVLLPWEQIERRLAGAVAAGFVLAIYNPTSGRRAHRFARAIELLRAALPADTPCALVRDASRPDEHATLLPLSAIEGAAVDMHTIVIVGNATTRILDGRLVTPRGYRIEGTASD
ncbi:MAG: precorrin-3B C(17)-methyltransferase [Dehalococcoidia bacterium]|nr:precorrin-3B C(17)-methyltransferase [Dehalococcoidia bacterium]